MISRRIVLESTHMPTRADLIARHAATLVALEAAREAHRSARAALGAADSEILKATLAAAGILPGVKVCMAVDGKAVGPVFGFIGTASTALGSTYAIIAPLKTDGTPSARHQHHHGDLVLA
jgi:hypothetical protein